MSEKTENEAAKSVVAPTILLTGATGYIGRRLLTRLQDAGRPLRCLARTPSKLSDEITPKTEVVSGDVLEIESLRDALAGIETAYYLVHLMGNSGEFESQDRQAAKNFGEAAKAMGVRRIIYLGGLGNASEGDLSPHLRSRHEVGQILRDSGVQVIEFRASVILGQGGISFEMIRTLTDRLPVMICPRWLATRTQPIAVDDVLAYLYEALDVELEESRIFEIGSPDVVTYGELIKEYARQRNLRRWLISVPILTPYLSSLWLRLVTPTRAGVGRHLIEGLRNPTVVQDDSALEVFSIRPASVEAAMRQALKKAGLKE